MQKRRVVASTRATAAKKVVSRTGKLRLLPPLRGSTWSCHPGYRDGSRPTTKQVFRHLASRYLHLELLAFGCQFLCPQDGDGFGYDAASSRTWQC
jgi:hypothetical protein